MQSIRRSVFAPALAAALMVASGYAAAQNTPTSPGRTGSVSSDAEVRRGVPGVDVDVNTRDRGRSAGVPGVDVDVRNPNRRTGDADTRRSGSGPMATERAARADRN